MADTQPNVLLIIFDQWSGSRLGVAGHPIVETPTIDQIAHNGIVFPRAGTVRLKSVLTIS